MLQWIPSHCDVSGNEQTDRLATSDAGHEREENSVSKPHKDEDHHKIPVQHSFSSKTAIINCQEQIKNHHIQTEEGHIRLNQHDHLHRVMKHIYHPQCVPVERQSGTQPTFYRYTRTTRHGETGYGQYQQRSRRSCMVQGMLYRKPINS